MKCDECGYYFETECRRYPPSWRGFVIVGPSSWCGEFKPKEAAYAVEERKIEESSIREHPRIDALWPSAEAGGGDSDEQGGEVEEKEIKKRGWPKGKPRK